MKIVIELPADIAADVIKKSAIAKKRGMAAAREKYGRNANAAIDESLPDLEYVTQFIKLQMLTEYREVSKAEASAAAAKATHEQIDAMLKGKGI